MAELIWQDPPNRTGAGGPPVKYQEEAAELRQHPKRWALLTTAATPRSANSLAGNARMGLRKAFLPVSDWEWKARGCEVYVRYIGEETS